MGGRGSRESRGREGAVAAGMWMEGLASGPCLQVSISTFLRHTGAGLAAARPQTHYRSSTAFHPRAKRPRSRPVRVLGVSRRSKGLEMPYLCLCQVPDTYLWVQSGRDRKGRVGLTQVKCMTMKVYPNLRLPIGREDG